VTTTFAFLKNKGGVGCTTTAFNFACWLAYNGKTVLFMDGDQQGDGTALCGIKHQPGMYNLLVNNQEFDDVWRAVPGSRYGRAPGDEKLWIVPNDERSGKDVSGSMADETVMATRLLELEGRFDVVIIDTSPSASEFHAGLYYAAHWLVYPTQAQTEPVNALKRSMQYYRSTPPAIATANGDIFDKGQVLGIIPCMYRRRDKLQIGLKGVLEGKSEDWGTQVLPELSDATVWQQAASQRTPIFLYDRRCRATKEANTLFKVMAEHSYAQA